MKRSKYTIILLVFAGALANCKSFPQNEMNSAKNTIQAAERVNANKYAAKDLNQAKSFFAKAEKQGKEKKYKDARTNFVVSKAFANTAYYHALKQFVDKEYNDILKAREVAMAAHIDKAVPEDYKKSEDTLKRISENKKLVEKLTAELKALQEKENQK